MHLLKAQAGAVADGSEAVYPAKFLSDVAKGDLIKVRLAGGGGYGDPLTRDPTRVRNDVAEKWISEAQATHVYGVVFHTTSPLTVNEVATARQRESLRASR